MEYEEEEERTFVPSAVSVPPKRVFLCDNQCSDKTLSYKRIGRGKNIKRPSGKMKATEWVFDRIEEPFELVAARWDAQLKGLVELKRRCQDTRQEIQVLNERQEFFF